MRTRFIVVAGLLLYWVNAAFAVSFIVASSLGGLSKDGKRRIFLLLLLLFPSLSFAVTVYVDNASNGYATGCSTPTATNYLPATRDCGTGGSATVYSTIDGAVDGGRTAGDIVYVRAGTYNENVTFGWNTSGKAGNYITVKAYNGETVTINGGTSYAVACSGTNTGYWWWEGINITATYNSDQSVMLLTGLWNNCLSDNSCADASLYGTHHFVLKDMNITGRTQVIGNNYIIKDSKFDGNSQWTVALWFQYSASFDNHVFGTKQGSLYASQGGNTACEIHHTKERGIWNMVTGSNQKNYSILVENCNIHDFALNVVDGNHGINFDGYSDSDGVQSAISRYNKIHTAPNGIGSNMENCYKCIHESNWYDGLSMGISVFSYANTNNGHDKDHRDDELGSYIRFNKFTNIDGISGYSNGVYIFYADGVTINNNSFYNISGNSTGRGSCLRLDGGSGVAAVDNLKFTNNTCSTWDDYAIYTSGTLGAGYDFSGNVFYDSSQTNVAYWGGNKYTLADFETLLGMDVGKFGNPNSINPPSNLSVVSPPSRVTVP